jgi:uncharacterized caspase-like protein
MSQAFAPRLFRAAVFLLFVALFSSFAHAPPAAAQAAEKRVALVIGNGHYKAAAELDNPSGDAGAIAASLRRLGFQVIEGHDLTIAQMRQAVADFSTALTDAKAAVVYYAGHGVSVDEENYLLPTDIVLKSATDLDLNAIGISLLLKQMKREDRINVVILDACRDNPFAAALRRDASRSVVDERGLSPVESTLARGTLIAFASDPKTVALDGPSGQHSPFTKALLDHIEDAGVPIDTVMNRVRSEVWEATKNKQLPWVNTSIIGEFALNPQAVASAPSTLPAAPDKAPAPTAEKLTQENLLWQSAERSGLATDYQAYLEAYPNGAFAHMARNRIASLEPAVSRGNAASTPAVQIPAAPKMRAHAPIAPPARNIRTVRRTPTPRRERIEQETREAAPRTTTPAARVDATGPSPNADPLRPCQPGAHSESFPSPSGYRCVLNR